MNTPAHAIVNLLALGRMSPGPVEVGAVVPDVPMVAFYAYHKLVLDTPERVIWSDSYWAPTWQALFDVLNSLPLVAVAALIAYRRRALRHVAFFASMALHSICDLLLHHDDAHRHFFPLSDWRFESPVSYWDPRYFGNVVGPTESLVVVTGALWLIARHKTKGARLLLGGVAALYAAYLGYAMAMWA